MKFLGTLCLNSESINLIIESGIIDTFSKLAIDKKAYKHYVNTTKAYMFKDLIQNCAMQSRDICQAFYKAFLNNYEILMGKAWDVTQHYIEMENQTKDGIVIAEDKKNMIKLKYEIDQIALELSCEAATHLLWYFVPDE